MTRVGQHCNRPVATGFADRDAADHDSRPGLRPEMVIDDNLIPSQLQILSGCDRYDPDPESGLSQRRWR